MQPRVQAGLSPDRECTPEQSHISLCRLQRLLRHKQLITSTLAAYRTPSFKTAMGIGSKHCEDGGKKKTQCSTKCRIAQEIPSRRARIMLVRMHTPANINLQNMGSIACSLVWRGCGSLRHVFQCGAVIQKGFCDHQSNWAPGIGEEPPEPPRSTALPLYVDSKPTGCIVL